MGLPLNLVLETFMRQYANERFDLTESEILKYKKDNSEVETLNTTFNKEIYQDFKLACKRNGYFLKHVIMAFMEKFVSKQFILEYVNVSEID